MWMDARRRWVGVFAALTLGLAQAVNAGPYAGPAYTSSEMVAWATQVHALVRGPLDIADPGGPLASFGASSDGLGASDQSVVSLGDGGSVTLGFADPVGDGPGDDFAVFENGFYAVDFFAEFAFVEVSSNGVDYARFGAVTLQSTPVGAFGEIDPTDYDNLAGDQPASFGTGFDLSELTSHPLVGLGLLDLQDIQRIRLVDVIGDGSTQDSLMNPIYDPYPTPFAIGTGGFDLDAVGVRNVPEPAAAASLLAGAFALLGLARRRTRRTAGLTLACLFALGLTAPSGALAAPLVVDFEDQGLSVGDFYNGSDFAGGFTSAGITFENSFTDFGGGFSGWNGFSSSAVADSTTPGFGNQYAAIPGAGSGGSTSYGVFFDSGLRMVLPYTATILSADVTNTTYAALSMLNGDSFAKQFGGPTGDDPDYLTLTITGYASNGSTVSSLDFDLADYRFADNALDYVIEDWTSLDLSSLGSVRSVGFEFEGSDVGDFGLNTPAYFAIDDITIVPEPGTALLLGLGLIGLSRRARDRKS